MVHKSSQCSCEAPRCSSPRGHLAQQAVWPKCLCVRVCRCVCVCVFACQDANKGMTDVPYECCPGTSPPLIRPIWFFIHFDFSTSDQVNILLIRPFSVHVDIFLFIISFSYPQNQWVKTIMWSWNVSRPALSVRKKDTKKERYQAGHRFLCQYSRKDVAKNAA